MNYGRLLKECHDRIKPYIHHTPVMTSRTINRISGTEVFFKCENFQRMGAFKMRGATNAILQLSEEQKAKGVVTHSSGNFAQAVALASMELNVEATIVMTENAPSSKKNAVKEYGGTIVECASNIIAREDEADRIVRETGSTLLHPSNQLSVILGQGTAAMELMEEVKNLDILLAPVGGGGLLAGTGLAAKYIGGGVEVVAGEPQTMDDAYRSFHSGKIELNDSLSHSIADGLRTNLGDVNFPIIMDTVSEIVRVKESDIISSMKTVYQHMKITIEPSSAVPVAALIYNPHRFRNKRVGVILSGGNVDLDNLPF